MTSIWYSLFIPGDVAIKNSYKKSNGSLLAVIFHFTLCVSDGTRCKGFLCSNDTCLPATVHCNGIQECPDGADEHNCGERFFLLVRERQIKVVPWTQINTSAVQYEAVHLPLQQIFHINGFSHRNAGVLLFQKGVLQKGCEKSCVTAAVLRVSVFKHKLIFPVCATLCFHSMQADLLHHPPLPRTLPWCLCCCCWTQNLLLRSSCVKLVHVWKLL